MHYVRYLARRRSPSEHDHPWNAMIGLPWLLIGKLEFWAKLPIAASFQCA
ncbi:MAG: hypothetical protein JWO91_1136 [Acidobacteriaceae bacterium]|nr:hypothetical protein [Acidobacteriaceae bacterium]